MIRALTDCEAEALGEDLRDGRPVAPGPLWPNAYAVVWPRGGASGPYRCGCNSSYGQSCPDCDGTAAEARDARKARRR